MARNIGTHGDEEAEVQRLRSALRTPQSDPQSLARIRAATHAAWQEKLSSRTANVARRRLIAALAAGILAAVIGVAWLSQRTAVQPKAVAIVVRVVGEAVLRRSHGASPVPIDPGTVLRVGDQIQALQGAALNWGESTSLRVRSQSAIRIADATTIHLDNGAVYVDAPGGRIPQVSLRVRTPHALIEHVGTQFAVAVRNNVTEVLVREGRVRIDRAGTSEELLAGDQVNLSASGAVQRASVLPFGTAWTWAEGLAPHPTIENRSLAEVLDWIGRESGRRIEYADAETRRRVAETRLHGSIKGLTPEQALSVVLGTTSLRYTIIGSVVRIERAADTVEPSPAAR